MLSFPPQISPSSAPSIIIQAHNICLRSVWGAFRRFFGGIDTLYTPP